MSRREYDEGEVLILQQMGEEHWEALRYVERYGLEAPYEAFADLEEWELVQREDDGGAAWLTTDLGDRVLQEGEA